MPSIRRLFATDDRGQLSGSCASRVTSIDVISIEYVGWCISGVFATSRPGTQPGHFTPASNIRSVAGPVVAASEKYSRDTSGSVGSMYRNPAVVLRSWISSVAV